MADEALTDDARGGVGRLSAMGLLFQHLCSRLSVVTGRNMALENRLEYPKNLRILIWVSVELASIAGASSLGDAKSPLGDAKSSLGDAKSSLGDTKSSLGDAESSLGDARELAG
jgi:hypothetical protein